MDAARLNQARILICDDQEANVELLTRMLEGAGYLDLTGTTDGETAVELSAESPPDLILLDLHMPEPDGFEVMRRLEPLPEGVWLPILVLTADPSSEAKQQALSAGARDFLTKPFDATEVLLRIENLLEARFLQLDLRDHNLRLEQTVQERTASLSASMARLERASQELRRSREETIKRLCRAVEYRDEETGGHIERMSSYCGLLAGLLDLNAESMRITSPMHDAGKIAIPDRILLKTGRLTEAERGVMEEHAEIGYRLLSGSNSELLELAATIAWTHHEKYDGTGYPRGLSGEAIPEEGRIAAIADVFDALTSARVYRPAFEVDQAVAIMREERGKHFDPTVLDLFLNSLDEVLAIRERYAPQAANGHRTLAARGFSG
jgi:putative two-component system response regulator